MPTSGLTSTWYLLPLLSLLRPSHCMFPYLLQSPMIIIIIISRGGAMLLQTMECLREYNVCYCLNSGIKRSLYFGPWWYGIVSIEGVILSPNSSHWVLIMCFLTGKGCPTDWQTQFSSSSTNLSMMTRRSRERTGIWDRRDPGYHATNRRYISRVILFFCRVIVCRSENRKYDSPYSTYLR